MLGKLGGWQHSDSMHQHSTSATEHEMHICADRGSFHQACAHHHAIGLASPHHRPGAACRAGNPPSSGCAACDLRRTHQPCLSSRHPSRRRGACTTSHDAGTSRVFQAVQPEARGMIWTAVRRGSTSPLVWMVPTAAAACSDGHTPCAGVGGQWQGDHNHLCQVLMALSPALLSSCAACWAPLRQAASTACFPASRAAARSALVVTASS